MSTSGPLSIANFILVISLNTAKISSRGAIAMLNLIMFLLRYGVVMTFHHEIDHSDSLTGLIG